MNPELTAWAWVAPGAVAAALGAAYTGRRLGLDSWRKKTVKKILASLLEMALCFPALRLMGRAWGHLATASGAYGLAVAVSVAVAAFWAGMTWLAAGPWIEARPLRAGESVVIEARLRPDHPVMEGATELTGLGGMIVETPALRVADEQAAYWRARAGNHTESARLLLNGNGATATVAVATRGDASLARRRVKMSGAAEDRVWAGVWVRYPERVLRLWGREWGPLWVWFAFTITLTEILQWVLPRRQQRAPYPADRRTR